MIGYITIDDINNLLAYKDFDPLYMQYHIAGILRQQGLQCSGREWCLVLDGEVTSWYDAENSRWVYSQRIK